MVLKAPGSRPLPLKQRTSSKDTRRDISTYTWRSLLVLIKLREYFVTVDNFSLWRRHLIFAIKDGKLLRNYMVQRFSSNMVFMSLMLSAELGVLFNSAEITTNVRKQLSRGNHYDVSFWAGFMIIVSALLTLLSLISTFTAWAMVNAVDESNVHAVFRSSIGQYAAELPGRFIVCSIYSFLISFLLFFFILLPVGIWSATLLCGSVVLFIHVVSSFSSFGRIIMHSGAMGHDRIFDPEYEMSLLPHCLHAQLLNKAKANLSQRTSITRQYRRKQRPLDRYFSEDELVDEIKNGPMSRIDENDEENPRFRRRADSLVRFADEELGEPDSVFSPPALSYASSSEFDNSHRRSLTPLSDISSQETPVATSRKDLGNRFSRTKNRPPTPLAIQTKGINNDLPQRRSTSAATSNGSATKLPLRSPGRNSITNPMPFSTTGSTSSLEQWLQASPTVSQKELNGDSGICGQGQSLGKSRGPSSSIPPPPPPSMPPPVVTTWRNSSTSSLGDGRDGSTDPRGQGVESILTGVLSHQEEERFAMDYGDITDDDFPVEAESRVQRHPSVQSFEKERVGSDDADCNGDTEFTSLLHHGRGNNHSFYTENQNAAPIAAEQRTRTPTSRTRLDHKQSANVSPDEG